MQLQSPLTKKLLRTSNDYIEALAAMDIHTVEDLLLYLPRAHEDLTSIITLRSASLDNKVSIRGTVSSIKLIRIRGGKRLVTALFRDSEGDMATVVWFNQPHIMRMLEEDAAIVLTGKLTVQGSKLQFSSPTFEREGERPLVHAGRLVPLYPEHGIITTRWLREKMPLLRSAVSLLPETLPKEVIEGESLLSRAQMVEHLHFPESTDDVQKARERRLFERAYEVQREALLRKQQWQRVTDEQLNIPMNVDLIKAFFTSLKFTPTESQRIAIYEILRDMEKAVPMSRLLEGDVGSGKTLVAVAVMMNVVHHRGQCAFMVPTEVLARQHAATIARLLAGCYRYLQEHTSLWKLPPPSIGLLTGSTPKPDADTIKRSLVSGTLDVLVGTHALIEEGVQFRSLRLAIIDEQHRFGVQQRERLREKGNPHVLAMTATPIPRTLALTAYGDHDLSVLLEKPGLRQPIETRVVSPTARKTVELFIDQQIEEGRQVFVICPLIEESDEIADVRNVERETERLRERFPHRRIARIHGQLIPEEKASIMQRVHAREYDILVATSVIEVGIDVPNATIMLIEGAERFGLAQLHQLRGRVGRGEHKSYCFLATTDPKQARSPRLKAMEEHHSGFALAEIDLQLRGPGELYGLRQSGMIPSMEMLFQPEIVVRARRAAERALGLTAQA